jgi:ABC-type glucose/galactose transport system permease subunit
VIGGVLSGLSVTFLTGVDGEAKSFSAFARQFVAFGTGRIGRDPVYSLPIVVLVTIIMLAVVFVMQRGQAWRGRYGSISSTFNSLYVPGTTIPLKKMFRTMLPVAAIAGACYALGGVMIAAKTAEITLGSGFLPNSMNGMLVPVLAGAFVGKVSIFGAKGSFLGASAGMLLVTAVFYALDFVLVPVGVQMCLQYLVIAFAVIKDLYSRFPPAASNL